MATGSKSARITPADGDAFFTSAMTATSPGRAERSGEVARRRQCCRLAFEFGSRGDSPARFNLRSLVATIRSRMLVMSLGLCGGRRYLSRYPRRNPDPKPERCRVTAEFWTEIGKMATAGGDRRRGCDPDWAYHVEPCVLRRQVALLPRWKPWRVPWGGFEVLALVSLRGCSRTACLLVKSRGYCLSAPQASWRFRFNIPLVIVAWRVHYPRWKPFRRDIADSRAIRHHSMQPIPIGAAFARAMTLAVRGLGLLTPIVLVIHGLVTWVSTQLDLTTRGTPAHKSRRRGAGGNRCCFSCRRVSSHR